MVVPEAVPTTFFDPATVGLDKELAARRSASSAIWGGTTAGSHHPVFIFFSVFKWEQRKGWDVLLRSYWAEFKR